MMKKILLVLLILLSGILYAQRSQYIPVLKTDTIKIGSSGSINFLGPNTWSGASRFYTGLKIDDTLAVDSSCTFRNNVTIDSNVQANNVAVNFRGWFDRSQSYDTIADDTLYVLKNSVAGVKAKILLNNIVYYLDDSLSVDLRTATSGVLRNGIYYISMTTPNVLNVSFGTQPTFSSSEVIVGFCFVDTLRPSGSKIDLIQERHTTHITFDDHYYKHYFLSARLQTVGALSGYTVGGNTDGAVTYAIAQTEFHDEDIEHYLAPTTDGQGLVGEYCNLYKQADGTWHIRFDSVPYLYAFGSGAYYNDITSLTGLASVTNNYYFNTYILATSFKGNSRYMRVSSQTQYSSLALAQAATYGNLDMSGFPVPEAVVIYKITFQYKTTYSTKGKCIIVVAPVAIEQPTSASVAITNDHNNLTNRNATASHPTFAISTDTSLMINKWTNQQTVNLNLDSLYYNLYQKADRLKQVNNIGLSIAASSATTFGCAVTTMGDSIVMAYVQNGVVYIINYNSFLTPSISYTGTTKNTQVSISNAYGLAFNGTNLWVTNQAGTLTKIDLANSATTTTYSIPAGEVGVAYGQDIIKINDTTLAISDSTNHRVVLFYTGTSRFITYDSLRGDGVSYPFYFNYLAYDGNRTIFMSDMRGFAKFDLFDSTSGVYYYCGQLNSYTSAVTFGTGIATDKQGYIYLNESYALSKWDTSGAFVGRVYNQRNIPTNMLYFNNILYLSKIASRSTTTGESTFYLYSTSLVPLKQWNSLSNPYHSAVDEVSKHFIINTYSGLSNTLRSVYVYKYW